MKTLSRIFIGLLSAGMLVACSPAAEEPEAMSGQMVPGETEVMDTEVMMDSEVGDIMEAEEEAENALNDLEAEEL